MAPPIPVYNRVETQHRFKQQLEDPKKYQCTLKSITQHECTFKTSPDRSLPPEIICLPFKRLFQRCLIPSGKGKKEEKRWVNIEITDSTTNSDLLEEKSRFNKDVQDFLSAEKDFRKLMEGDADGNI